MQIGDELVFTHITRWNRKQRVRTIIDFDHAGRPVVTIDFQRHVVMPDEQVRIRQPRRHKAA